MTIKNSGLDTAELEKILPFVSLGEMVVGITHDYRNHLTKIETLISRIKGEENVRIVRQIDGISEQMTTMINNILSFTRESFGDTSLSLMNEVNKVILLLGNLKAEDIEVCLKFKDTPNIIAPSAKVLQILINLISNSIQAIKAHSGADDDDNDEGGKITISCGKDGQFAALRIVDTGIGIPQSDIPYIFDNFFTTKDKGTGIGLGIVKRYLNEMGGDIAVQSKVNEGTAFVARFPLKVKGGEND